MPAKKVPILVAIFQLFFSLAGFAKFEKIHTDVLVVGGGTSGVAAGIQSARLGVRTLIVEQTGWLGGMLTAGGVSCTDGNNLLRSGIWQEFRQHLYEHYGTHDLASGWVSETCFEPLVGDSIFKAMVAAEKKLSVQYGWFFDKVLKSADTVTGVLFVNLWDDSLEVKAKIVVDATELGDVFADAGAAYDLGMEDKAYSKESMAPGKNPIIQDLTWVAILKDFGTDTAKKYKPLNYDSTQYYCSCTDAPCPDGKSYNASARKMLDYGKLPDSLYMINWPAHGNDYYLNAVEEKPIERLKLYQRAKDQTLGFVYFLETELGFYNLGLMDNYFPTTDRLALIPYNREGRRVRGLARLNVNHLINPYSQKEKLYRTGIAVGDYPVDHHHDANSFSPKISFPRVNSFNIPLGALIPERTDGLVVSEKGISVSNIANGATRLQPCVLLTGQAAGALAALSVKKKKQPRQANIREIQQLLLESKCILMPFVDVHPEDPNFIAIQRVSLAGILKGIPKPGDWENRTYFYPDSLIRVREWGRAMKEYDRQFPSDKLTDTGYLTIKETFKTLLVYFKASGDSLLNVKANNIIAELGDNSVIGRRWESFYFLNNYRPNRNITRRELAVLIYYLRLASNKDWTMDWKGNFLRSRQSYKRKIN